MMLQLVLCVFTYTQTISAESLKASRNALKTKAGKYWLL